jgi:hypothetical protein
MSGSAASAMLHDMLQGRTVTVITALMDYNLMTPNARASELRKAGWPINSLQLPHPKLAGETITGYSMDAHFRDWWIKNGNDKRPIDYAPQAGRGKFAKETKK